MPWLRGQMCSVLGLRYAPEIRFYRDNTAELYNEQVIQANEFMKSMAEEKKESTRGKMQQTLDKLERINTFTPD